MISIEIHKLKYYHLGFGKSVSRSNLANPNEKRNYKIFEELAYHLIDEAKRCCTVNDFELDIEENVYAFDSTTIDLCLSVFWWTKFSKTKAGIKLHALFDVKTSIPGYIHILKASFHDVNPLDLLFFEPGSYYIIDRTYVDFRRLYNIHTNNAFFVTRAKSNLKFKRMYSNKACKEKGNLCNQISKLQGFYSAKEYPSKLRRIKYYDDENNSTFVFITNNFELEDTEIALVYKYRWKIELFFKWIKQHL
ncbi:unnamed protein product, partial [marine sediment metagenome]